MRFFASTPPLEAKRLLCYEYASRRWSANGKPLEPSFIDIKKTYFNATHKRQIFLYFPREMCVAKGNICHLKRCVYGTRDTGLLWENTCNECREAIGFRRGVANPCCFFHAERDLSLVVHGNDFTTRGTRSNLVGFEESLAQHFEIKIRGHLGEAADCCNETRILNRVVRLAPEGLRHESDPRHAETLLRSLEISSNSVSSKTLRETYQTPSLLST